MNNEVNIIITSLDALEEWTPVWERSGRWESRTPPWSA